MIFYKPIIKVTSAFRQRRHDLAKHIINLNMFWIMD